MELTISSNLCLSTTIFINLIVYVKDQWNHLVVYYFQQHYYPILFLSRDTRFIHLKFDKFGVVTKGSKKYLIWDHKPISQSPKYKLYIHTSLTSVTFVVKKKIKKHPNTQLNVIIENYLLIKIIKIKPKQLHMSTL